MPRSGLQSLARAAIGHFPRPYPDETIYSLCARFQTRMGFRGGAANGLLFGSLTRPALLPTGLGGLVRRLPRGWGTTHELIVNHTLYPLVSPFVPRERAMALYRQMAATLRVHGISIHRSMKPRQPDTLRYCPQCALEDRTQHGETYWHRQAQVPGIPLCGKHRCVLVATTVTGRERWSGSWVPAERVVPPELRVDQGGPDDRGAAFLIRMAQAAAWLMQQERLPFTLEDLLGLYPYLLFEASYASYSGIVRIERLTLHCQEQLAGWGDVLNHKAGSFSWVERLAQASKGRRHIYPPEQHLALMTALGQTPASLAELKVPKFMSAPFGRGPWPCLNPVAPLGHRATARVGMNWSTTRNNGQPAGHFFCSCGFRYMRVGPDRSRDDRLKFTRIEAVGRLWQKELRRAWDDPEVSSYTLQRRFGVSARRLAVEARTLSLTLPRISRTERLGVAPTDAVPTKRTDRRAALLGYLKQHPTANRTEVLRVQHTICEWLRRNDREWLEANLPVVTRGRDPRRDAQLAREIDQAVRAMRRELPGRPVSVMSLERRLQRRLAHRDRFIGMPLTLAAIDRVRQSRTATVMTSRQPGARAASTSAESSSARSGSRRPPSARQVSRARRAPGPGARPSPSTRSCAG